MRIAMLFGACVLLWAGNVGAVVITTADNKLDTVFNSNNSGFWSTVAASSPSTDIYVVGLGHTRDFFTFDLSGVTDTVVSATLIIPSGLSGAPNLDPEILTLWDVSTDAATLNDTGGPEDPNNSPIFDDLGSGTVYGTVSIPVGTATDVIVALNADAIAAINAENGYFSIGGMMTSDGATGTSMARFLFGATQGVAVSLDLTVEEQMAVPEPASLAVFATALVGLGLVRRRRARG